MEPILTINVKLSKDTYYIKGKEMDVCMLPFTGTAQGPYFNGKVLGEGVDTQNIYHDGHITFSARYMLEGVDYKGNQCRIFIENTGNSLEHLVPAIETDSEALQLLIGKDLSAQVIPVENGVTVNIYESRA